VAYVTAGITTIFFEMTRGGYDVAEYGLSYFLRMWDTDSRRSWRYRYFRTQLPPLAVFSQHPQRHRKAGRPTGKTIGEFACTATTPASGQGHPRRRVRLQTAGVRWIIGGTDHPIPAFSWIPQPLPPGVDVRHTGDRETLGAMLERGEIDALISVDVPQAS